MLGGGGPAVCKTKHVQQRGERGERKGKRRRERWKRGRHTDCNAVTERKMEGGHERERACHLATVVTEGHGRKTTSACARKRVILALVTVWPTVPTHLIH